MMTPSIELDRAERDLQQALAQAINAERQTGAVRCRAREVARIVRKYRINHEKAQKSDREDGGERTCGAEFLLVHGNPNCEV
jgi:hypothetical protein